MSEALSLRPTATDPIDRPRLLIIDDELRIATSLRDLLSDIGEAFCSTDGTEAVSLVQDIQPDLILLDVAMPFINGLEVCSNLKAMSAYKDIPVIFITGSISSDIENRAFEVGAVDFISKPFNFSTTRARIKTHLTLKQRSDQLLLNIAQRKESEERFRMLVESAADAYFVYDFNGRFIEVNKTACESLGYTRDELLQMSAFHINADVRIERLQKDWGALDLGATLTVEGKHRRKDGTLFPVEVRISVIYIGGQKCMLALARDTTQRERAEEVRKIYERLYQDSSEAVVVTDESNRIISVNRAFTEITGYDLADVVGRKPSILKSGHQDTAFYKRLWKKVHTTGRFKAEIWNRKKNGQFFAAQLTINTISNEDGKPHRYVALISDITEKKKSEELMWHQANFDPLTGLPNRHFFREHLENEVKNAKRSRLPIALMLLDLDGFKDVNDSHGHDTGDQLLKKVAERLRSSIRESDAVARLGGDEFTVILTNVSSPDNIDKVAIHILDALSQPFKVNDEVVYVSASIGITLYPNDGISVEDLIRNADQAMYVAKQEGKNQYRYFTQTMHESTNARIRLIGDLRDALADDQFQIVYQPIVDFATGTIRKAEALIRWHHPARGLINPVDFISTAEDTGMISSFGNWVFREAAKQVSLWRKKYHPAFQISINISPVQFKREGLNSSMWFGHLKSLNLPGQGIVVEITEGLLLDSSLQVLDQLLMLKQAGIEVALDDFGTGYSSLAYLKKFDIDYIKIDKVFIQNLTANSEDMVLCEAIIGMAHKLGIQVIAEGIETAKQHELLATAGCDYGQGYFFSRPVSADKLEYLLQTAPFSYQESLNL